MLPTTPATYQADERLATHLLGLGFTETTASAYHKARGDRSFYHPARRLSVWLAPGSITVQAGAHWRFQAQGHVLAEVLDFLLTTVVSPVAPPTAGRPSHLPELGCRLVPHGTPTAGQLPPLAGGG